MKIDPEWEVTPAEVKAMLDGKEDFLLLDVRRQSEWDRAHLEGAVLVPLQELAARAGELGAHKGRRVVTLCHHGVRSLNAAAMLKRMGFGEVKSMAGGIEAYSVQVDGAIPRY